MNLSYGYDPLNRLDTESGILASTYSYDGNGNRLSQSLVDDDSIVYEYCVWACVWALLQ